MTMARNALEMTQERLAELAGVTQGAISHWEKGIRIPDDAALERERRAEDVAGVAREPGPVHAELEGLDEARDDADAEAQQHRLGVVPRQPQPGLVAGAQPARLHDRDLEGQADRDGDDREVDERRQRELPARQVQRDRCEWGGEGVHEGSPAIRPAPAEQGRGVGRATGPWSPSESDRLRR